MPSTTQFTISVTPIFYLRARYKVPSAEEKNNFTIISRTNVACESSSICRYCNVCKLAKVHVYMMLISAN